MNYEKVDGVLRVLKQILLGDIEQVVCTYMV